MQGTVKDYDIPSRTGTLLTDQEEPIQIDPGSMEGSGLRYLRIGQRVRFEVAQEEGKKVARGLRIVSF